MEELNAIRNTYWARGIYDSNPRLRRAINTLVDGTVPTDDEQRELFTALLDGASWHRPDHYFILKDYDSSWRQSSVPTGTMPTAWPLAANAS